MDGDLEARRTSPSQKFDFGELEQSSGEFETFSVFYENVPCFHFVLAQILFGSTETVPVNSIEWLMSIVCVVFVCASPA